VRSAEHIDEIPSGTLGSDPGWDELVDADVKLGAGVEQRVGQVLM
jgi:hypothetical protein